MGRKRTIHAATFKAKVAIAAVKELETGVHIRHSTETGRILAWMCQIGV